MLKRILTGRFTATDVLMSIVVFSFFLCQYGTGLPIVGTLLQAMEAQKVKYTFALVAAVILTISGTRADRAIYARELYLLLSNAAILATISVLIQMRNGFEGDTFNETMYFVVPAVLTWALISHEHGITDKYIDLCFSATIVSFFALLTADSVVAKIRSGMFLIDFVNSYSPLESGLSFYAAVFSYYYTITGQKAKSIIAVILSILSMKRLAMISAVAFFFAGTALQKVRIKRLPCVIVFCVIPMLMSIIFNVRFAAWFQQVTSLDLNRFMMGRFDFINVLVDSDQIKYGLGSCRKYLSTYYQGVYNTRGIVEYYDTHNDILRFYLECGLLGSLSLAYSNFYLTTGKTSTTVLVFYIFVECCFNHLFGAGNTMYWLLVYLVIYRIDQHKSNELSISPLSQAN